VHRHLVRGFYFIVDPNMSRMLWNYLGYQILYTVTFPLDLLATLLITLFVFTSFPYPFLSKPTCVDIGIN